MEDWSSLFLTFINLTSDSHIHRPKHTSLVYLEIWVSCFKGDNLFLYNSRLNFATCRRHGGRPKMFRCPLKRFGSTELFWKLRINWRAPKRANISQNIRRRVPAASYKMHCSYKGRCFLTTLNIFFILTLNQEDKRCEECG